MRLASSWEYGRKTPGFLFFDLSFPSPGAGLSAESVFTRLWRGEQTESNAIRRLTIPRVWSGSPQRQHAVQQRPDERRLSRDARLRKDRTQVRTCGVLADREFV